ncbi:CPBP family intramembrane glutamic endopeptidase [Haladaptatus sp. NG-SE-30]
MADGAAVGGESTAGGSLGQMVLAVVRSGVLGLSSLFAIGIWLNVLLVVAGGDGIGTMLQSGLGVVALGLGTGTVALLFMLGRGYDISYIDLALPSKRDWGYVVGGVVSIFVILMAISILLSQLGIGTADHSIEQTARQGNAEILLLFIPLSWLIIGPGEELLYRNIIQKSLYETFSEYGALVVASGIFALAHVLAYAPGSTLTELAGTLTVIFFLSLVLGFTYLKTRNLVVSALIHGTFDAILFGLMYLQFAG